MRDHAAEIQERSIDTAELRTRYLTAGSGSALILLHGAGENASDWQWVLPELARTHRVYALDLIGASEARTDGISSPELYARLLATFLAALGIERAAVVGNSLGGLIALHFALSVPSQVTALGLVNSAGLGRAIHPAILGMIVPGAGDVGTAWSMTPIGALHRIGFRAPLLFAHPGRAPAEWYAEQYRLAQLPNFLPEVMAVLRAQIDLRGQRVVLLDELPRLRMPTLVVWGERDLIFPLAQAQSAMHHLRDGQLVVIPDCGHLPHVEAPARCAAAITRLLVQHPMPGE